jgi:hypothetical protein
MAGLPLFDVPNLVPQRPQRPALRFVATTSRTAYEQLKPKLPTREAFVLSELRTYELERRDHPTAYELFQFADQRHPQLGLDLNDIRPRLTDLANEKGKRKDGRTYVQKVARRRCAVNATTAWTWRVL